MGKLTRFPETKRLMHLLVFVNMHMCELTVEHQKQKTCAHFYMYMRVLQDMLAHVGNHRLVHYMFSAVACVGLAKSGPWASSQSQQSLVAAVAACRIHPPRWARKAQAPVSVRIRARASEPKSVAAAARWSYTHPIRLRRAVPAASRAKRCGRLRGVRACAGRQDVAGFVRRPGVSSGCASRSQFLARSVLSGSKRAAESSGQEGSSRAAPS